MRIKGSDLRKIIKEEITRAHRMNEVDDSLAALPAPESPPRPGSMVTKRILSQTKEFRSEFLAKNFLQKLVELVRPGSQDNALKDALTLDPSAGISFSGTISQVDVIHDVKIFAPDHMLIPMYDYTKMTVGGKSMPEDVISRFDSHQFRIALELDEPISFTGFVRMTYIDNIEDFSDISLLGSGETYDLTDAAQQISDNIRVF